MREITARRINGLAILQTLGRRFERRKADHRRLRARQGHEAADVFLLAINDGTQFHENE